MEKLIKELKFLLSVYDVVITNMPQESLYIKTIFELLMFKVDFSVYTISTSTGEEVVKRMVITRPKYLEN